MYLILIGKKNFHTYLISDQEANRCKTMFKNLITAHPDDELHEAYFGLAKIYFHLNRLDVAYDCIFKAVKIRPSDHVYLLWKGLILFYLVSVCSLEYFEQPKKDLLSTLHKHLTACYKILNTTLETNPNSKAS